MTNVRIFLFENMRRIFVAVDISDEVRRKVINYIENLRRDFRQIRVGWDKSEKLHLTLNFLGDADENQLENLIKIVGEISAQIDDFYLQLADTGVFPNARNPRVLWIDVKDEKRNLEKINELLEKKCEEMGFAREKRKYIPHLTIGRVREPNRASELAKKHLANKFEPVEFSVSQIVIYESQLLPTGSIYSIVSKHGLQ